MIATLRFCAGILLILASLSSTNLTAQSRFSTQGQILDEAGTPIEGMKITFETDGSPTGDLLGSTDAKGRFAITVETAETRAKPNYLLFQKSGYASFHFAPGTAQDMGVIMLPKSTSLRGWVRQKSGKPIAGASIRAGDAITQSPIGRIASRIEFICVAESDAKGAFTLHSALTVAATIRCSAPGFYNHTLEPFSRGEPLSFELIRGGLIRGTVVGADKRPCQATVRAKYEYGLDSDQTKTAEDGSFTLNLKHPGRLRLHASTKTSSGYSEILSAPCDGLIIALESHDESTKPLTIHAIDKKTKAPIKNFDATAWWHAGGNQIVSFASNRLSTLASCASIDGVVELPGPSHPHADAAALQLNAEGYARFRNLNLKSESREVTIELYPEATLQGLLSDSVTKKPIAGAKVWAVAKAPGNPILTVRGQAQNSPPDKGDLVVSTDADGAYRIGSLPAGTFEIHCAHPEHPSAPPITVTVLAEEQKLGLTLTLPHGLTLSGKLTNLPRGEHLHLTLAGVNRRRSAASFYTAGSQASAQIESDGTFRFHGLERKSYKLSIVTAIATRHGRPQTCLLETIDMRGEDKKVELDASNGLPGVVKGKVTIKGIGLPPNRLLVTAEPATNRRSTLTGVFLQRSLAHPHAIVRPNGSYSLSLAPGRYKVRVLDLATHVQLGESLDSLLLDGGATVEENLTCELVKVHVRLEPETEGQSMFASRLELCVKRENDLRRFMQGGSRDSLIGLALSPGQGEIDIVLPRLETEIKVRLSSQNLGLKGDSRDLGQPLCSEDWEPGDPDNETLLVIKVPPPPSLSAGR